MAINFMKVRQGLSIKPNTVPSSPENGDIYYDSATDLFKFYQNGTVITIPTSSSGADSSSDITNLGLSFSAASNALTIALKGKDGNDPSSTNVVSVGFRNSTASTGTYTIRQVTSALSLTISSGSTLGGASGYTHYGFVYAVDNGTNFVLGAAMTQYDEGTIFTTTAEGGAGAADSNSAIYTTATQTSKPIRIIARFKFTNSTAGNWGTTGTGNVSEVSPQPFADDDLSLLYSDSSSLAFNSGASVTITYNTKNYDTHNAFNGATGIFTAPVAGRYFLHAHSTVSNGGTWAINTRCSLTVQVNGADQFQMNRGTQVAASGTTNVTNETNGTIVMNLAKGDTMNIQLTQTSGTNLTASGGANQNYISIFKLK